MQGKTRSQRTIPWLLLGFLALGAYVALVGRFATVSAGPHGNEAKGKYYYRQTCKTCHTKGAAGGELTPLSKTQEQWRRFFAAGKHGKNHEPLTKLVTAEQLRDMEAFLVAHAADSPQPETCGK